MKFINFILGLVLLSLVFGKSLKKSLVKKSLNKDEEDKIKMNIETAEQDLGDILGGYGKEFAKKKGGDDGGFKVGDSGSGMNDLYSYNPGETFDSSAPAESSGPKVSAKNGGALVSFADIFANQGPRNPNKNLGFIY